MTVLVVGAGPTGLLLAAELRRRQVPCRLIDHQKEPLHWDRATVIHPRSLEVFHHLGLLDRFLEAGVPQRSARLHADGELVGELDLASCGSRFGFNLGLSEEVTETILTDYLRSHGGEVERSTSLVDLQASSEAVQVALDHQGSTEVTEVEWVIGCDGLHSVTREKTGIGLVGHDIAVPWAVFDAATPSWSEPWDANQVYLDALPVILTALPDRRWRVYLHPSGPQSDLVGDALSTLRRYHPDAALEDVTNPTRFHCHTKVATKFRSGRVLLAGDAAHLCSPSQGHGMNSGLQDAFNLAWKLSLVCRAVSSPELLDSYEAERRPVAEMITQSGDAAEALQSVRLAQERRARDDELRATFSNPTKRHHEVIAEAELDIDYGRSPIVMGDDHPALGPGQRLPSVVRAQSDERGGCYLDELAVDAAHVALLATDGSKDTEALRRDVEAARKASLVGSVMALGVVGDGRQRDVRLDRGALELLGTSGATLLVVRPDGHVGLRADRGHREALVAYQRLLSPAPAPLGPSAPPEEQSLS